VSYAFSFLRYSVPFKMPVRTAHGFWSQREGVLVRLSTADGVVGYGEASPITWFGSESVDEIAAVCAGFGKTLADEQISELPTGLGCLQVALEAAREDFGMKRAEGSPPEAKDAATGLAYAPVAALLPAGKPALQKVDTLAEAGFRTFKWKVGVADLEDELGLLDELIGRLPKGARLRLDANGAWDRRKAERWLERCADRPIEFIEQPIAREDRRVEDVSLGLAGDYPTPLALDESVATGKEVGRWLDLGWPGYFVIKPQLLGPASEVLAQLSKRNCPVVFSSALETAVGARSALRLALRHGTEGRAVGFGVYPLFEDGRLDGLLTAPFIRREDVDTMRPEDVWNVLS
jgi:o-succinylbenzoate synthase